MATSGLSIDDIVNGPDGTDALFEIKDEAKLYQHIKLVGHIHNAHSDSVLSVKFTPKTSSVIENAQKKRKTDVSSSKNINISDNGLDLLWSTSIDGKVKQWGVDRNLNSIETPIELCRIATQWGHQLAVTNLIALPAEKYTEESTDLKELPLNERINTAFNGSVAITTSLDCTVRKWGSGTNSYNGKENDLDENNEKIPIELCDHNIGCIELGPAESLSICYKNKDIEPNSLSSDKLTTLTVGGFEGRIRRLDFKIANEILKYKKNNEKDNTKTKSRFAALLGVNNEEDEEDEEEDEESKAKKEQKIKEKEHQELQLKMISVLNYEIKPERIVSSLDYSDALNIYVAATDSGNIYIFKDEDEDLKRSQDSMEFDNKFVAKTLIEKNNSIKVHSSNVKLAKFDPKTKTLLATVGYDGKLNILDLSSGVAAESKILASKNGHLTSWIISLAWHPSGEYLATGSTDGTIIIYKLECKDTNKALYELNIIDKINVDSIRKNIKDKNAYFLSSKGVANIFNRKKEKYVDEEVFRRIKDGGILGGSYNNNNESSIDTIWSIDFNSTGDLLAIATESGDIFLLEFK